MALGDDLVYTPHVALSTSLLYHLHALWNGEGCPIWDAHRHWRVRHKHRGTMVRAFIHKVLLAGLTDWRNVKKRLSSVEVGYKNCPLTGWGNNWGATEDQ